MNTLTIAKLPLRAARTIYRALRPLLPEGFEPAPPPPRAPPAPPKPRAQAAIAPEVAAAPAPEAVVAPVPEAPRVPVQVYVEETPNPNALKFICSVVVVHKGSLAFDGPAQAESHPLASALFELGGVRTVFAVKDFVTITRDANAPWPELEPRIIDTIQRVLGP